MPYTDIRKVRACYGELRDLFMANPGGTDDAQLRLRVAALCRDGIEALDDAECRHALSIVEARAATLFSADGHEKWRSPRMSGVEALRLQILIDLETVNTRLFMLDAMRSRPAGPAMTAHLAR